MAVHIRRTDHLKAIQRSPEELFVQRMEAYGHERHFFLATDDVEVEKRMKRRFGARLASSSKRTLDRNATAGVQDALVDLLLLAQGSEAGCFAIWVGCTCSRLC